ncbi:hypothetical protein JCM10908_005699 [Rhodotorula pacifica]|uniref:reverse transcriptase family protein n=1 Tax=Rhodotorula pacifica TaxID=1495444 RepID=UPI00317247BF
MTMVEQVQVESSDIVAIDLRTASDQLLRIFNIYNPAAGSAEHLLTHNESVRKLGAILPLAPSGAHIVVAGDFNLHHQEWEPALAQEPSPEAQEASRTFRDAGLVHLLPPGTETYRAPSGSTHCNDLVLADLRTEECMVSCQIDEALNAQPDHRPLRLVLDLALPAATEELRRSFRRASPEKLIAAYTRFAAELPPPAHLNDIAALDLEGERLTEVLQLVVEAAVPLSKSRHPRYAQPWWSPVVAQACAEARRLKNVAWRKAQRGDVDAAEASTTAKVAANRKKALMRRKKARWERRAVDGIDAKNLWRKAKEATGSAPAHVTTPPLQAGTDSERNTTYATSPAAKLELLRPVLLPQVQRQVESDVVEDAQELQGSEQVSIRFSVSTTRPRLDGIESRFGEALGVPAVSASLVPAAVSPPTRLSTPHHHTPTETATAGAGLLTEAEEEVAADPDPITLDWPDLREDEVKSALFGARALPYSAAGSDGVPFIILQHLWPALRDRLLPLYSASLRLGHLPRSWRDAVGVVLRKPKKGDYSLAKAYRLIAFEKTSAKVLESIVAQRLAYLAEHHQLLPPEHFGGRQGRSVDKSVACFVDEIKSQWRQGNVVVGIALDVAKAFPSVDTEVLCSELRKKGLPTHAVSWIRSFMSDRTCDLRLEGVSSGPVEWRSGLPQGSPLSPVLYLFYNAPALASLQSPTSLAVGWIDDINLLVWGKSAEAAIARANQLMPALEEWSKTHLSDFEPSKSDAVLYTPHNKKVSASLPDVVLAGSPIPWSPSLTMLGTIIDEKLTFEPHVAACASKASIALTGVRLLSNAHGYL